MTDHPLDSVEQLLREELGRGDAVIAASRPILRHLVANDDRGLLNEEAIARIRGMIGHVATQLLFAEAAAGEADDPAEYAAQRRDERVRALLDETALLSHAHALALEAQTAERLRGKSGVDAVLTPLVQELAAAKDADTAALAMAVLAAQARFMQQQRRMELPLGELPGDLFHSALVVLRTESDCPAERRDQVEQRLRASFDEATSRLGLLSRLVMSLGENATRALAVDHAGLAIFATALAMVSGQERDLTVLSFADGQFARLALGLRAAGVGVREHFLYFCAKEVPEGIDGLPAERAAALLASAA